MLFEIKKQRLSLSHLFIVCAVGFLIGVMSGLLIKLDFFIEYVLILTCILFLIFIWSNKKLRVIFMCAIFLLLGFLRANLSEFNESKNSIKNLAGKNLEFSGQVLSEPDERQFYVKLTLGNLKLDSGSESGMTKKEKISGKILVNADKYVGFEYADWLKVKCKIKLPEKILAEDEWTRDFDYAKYLEVQGVEAICSADSVEKIENLNSKNVWQIVNKKLISAKLNFKKSIDKSLVLPHSAILNAMLLGYRQEINENLRNDFSAAGVSHVIAISGLHISLLAGIIFYIFMFLGVARQKSFWPTILVLLMYVCLIGWRASAMRALLMTGIVLYGLKIGRLAKSLNALLMAGMILLILNPQLILYDLGFQLSFLAMLGIILGFDWLNENLKFISERFKIRSIVAMTLSAQMLSVPLVVYTFGIFSNVAWLANLLILPILPAVMIVGIILVLVGLIWSKLAIIVGVIEWILMSLILKIVEVLNLIPYASFKIKSFGIIWAVIFYIVIGLIYLFLKIKKNEKIYKDIKK